MILVLCLSTAFSSIFGRDDIDHIDTKDASDAFTKLGKNSYGILLKSEFIQWAEETFAVLPPSKLGNLFLILASQENMKVNPANYIESTPYVDSESEANEYLAHEIEPEYHDQAAHGNKSLQSTNALHVDNHPHSDSKDKPIFESAHITNESGDASHHAGDKKEEEPHTVDHHNKKAPKDASHHAGDKKEVETHTADHHDKKAPKDASHHAGDKKVEEPHAADHHDQKVPKDAGHHAGDKEP